MRERPSLRINLALERLAEWFSHSQDPQRTSSTSVGWSEWCQLLPLK
jgi:hypothetical protein